MNHLSNHKKIALVIGIIAGIVVVALVFEAGMAIGSRKAMFTRNWDDHYDDNVAPGRGAFGAAPDRLPDSHGAIGTIASLSQTSFVVIGRDGTEKTIVFSTTTIMREGHENSNTDDLKIGIPVAVIGDPNASGQIDAKFIRILPQQ